MLRLFVTCLKSEKKSEAPDDLFLTKHLPKEIYDKAKELNLLDCNPHQFIMHDQDGKEIMLVVQLEKDEKDKNSKYPELEAVQVKVMDQKNENGSIIGFENKIATSYANFVDGCDYVAGLHAVVWGSRMSLAECEKETTQTVKQILETFNKLEPKLSKTFAP